MHEDLNFLIDKVKTPRFTSVELDRALNMAQDRFGYGTEKKPDLKGFLNSKEHKKWLNSPWNPEVDIHMLKSIFGAMHLHGG